MRHLAIAIASSGGLLLSAMTYVHAADPSKEQQAIGYWSATDIPKGVNYSTASVEALAKASAALHGLATGGEDLLLHLLGKNDESFEVGVGPYLALHMAASGLRLPKSFDRLVYVWPLDEKIPEARIEGYTARVEPQKRLLAQYLMREFEFQQPAKIRPLNFDELALVWYGISWDLSEPLFVMEIGGEKFVFDFDTEKLRVTWIERLTSPCFSAQAGDGKVLPCACASVDRRQQEWRVRFAQAKNSCSAGKAIKQQSLIVMDKAGPFTIATDAKGASFLNRNVAFVRVTEDSSRGDALVMRSLADKFSFLVVGAEQKGFKGIGKLVAGGRPETPIADDGAPIRGYVLLASVVDADGKFVANRGVYYSDQRLLDAVLRASDGWQVEPARHLGQPVPEAFWQEIFF